MNSDGRSVDRWGDRLLRIFWRKPAGDVAERTRRRVTLHLVPYLFFLYILAYIDRMNVAVAGLAMKQSVENGGLGFDDKILGFGIGLFFWGYWILEIPSTNWVERRGARWVFVRILILWGVVAAAMGAIGSPLGAAMFSWLPHLSEGSSWFSPAARFINRLSTSSENQFYFFRFFLGFFEGGFFPSVIVYLSHWFRQRDRAKAIATFALAMPLSSVIGYTFNAFFLRAFQGWRMIFVIEGVLPILAGITTIFLLPDRPGDARWLSAEEREWLTSELNRDTVAKRQTQHMSWPHLIFMVILLTAVYFFQNMLAYGLSAFMPRIMSSQVERLPHWFQTWFGLTSLLGGKARQDQINFVGTIMATLPYYVSFFAILINGWHSDKTGERIWHAAVPMAFCSLGVAITAALIGATPAAVLALIFISGACVYTQIPPFWSIPTMFLGAGAAASAIGFINMVGNLGSSVGPTLFGNSSDANIEQALWKIAPWSFVGAVLVVVMDAIRRGQLARRERSKP